MSDNIYLTTSIHNTIITNLNLFHTIVKKFSY